MAGNDIEITVRVANQTNAGFTQVNAALTKLKKKAEEATTALTGLHAAASNIEMTATLDDQTEATFQAIAARLDGLRAASAQIAVTADDQTEATFAAITARLDDLKAASAQIAVTVDNQTTADLDAIKIALDDLKAHSPVKLDVTFDGQTADITAAAQAMADLKGDAQSASTGLRTVATRATAAAAGLNQVHDAAQNAARGLLEVAAAGQVAAAALNEVRSSAGRAATALRRVGDRADDVGGQLLTMGDHTDRLSRQMDDLRDSSQDAGDAMRGLRGTLPNLTGALRGASGAAGDSGGGGGGRGLAGALGSVAAVSGLAAAALGSAAPAVAGVGAALAQLAPAAGVAATGILAMVSAQAALKIGTQGVGEALKNAFDPDSAEAYAEALKKLSPNARSFVETIRGMGPAFKELRLDVQDKLFSGFGKSLSRTAKDAGPALKRSLLDSAGALNLMGKGVLDTAREMGKSGALGTALDGANAGLKNMSKLPATLVQGLVQVGAAAAPAFERMTKAGGNALDRLSQKMTRGLKSGAMERSISTAVDLAKQLGQGLGNVGQIFGNIGRAADQSGAGLIGNFKTLTGELAKVTATSGVQDGLRTLFQTMGTVGRTAASLLGEAVKGLAPVITALGPPVQALVKNLGAGLSSVMRSLSPILAGAADSFGRIVTAVSPLATVLGGLVSGALDAFAPLLGEVGDQAALLVESLAAQLGPTLDRLPDLLGPLMDVFGDLASLWVSIQNDVLKAMLPSFKRMGEAFGRVAGSLAPLLPLFTDFVEFGLRGVGKVAEVGARGLGKLADAITSRVAPALESMAKWAGGHKLEIMQVFNAGKDAAYGFAIAVGESLPTVFGLFKALGTIVLESLGVIVNGAADAFGWIPGIGPKIKDAAKGFNLFADLVKKGMDKAGRDINGFVAENLPKLKRNRLEMNISNWSDQIKEAKRQLSDKNLPPKKRAKLEADIRAWQDNIAAAKRQIGGVRGKGVKLNVSTNARAMAGAAMGAIQSIPPYTLKTVHIQFTSSGKNSLGGAVRAIGSADGNIFRSFADGAERHVAEIAQPTMRVWAEPETGGEAYIPLSPAKRGRSVAILEEVADRFGFGLEKFARGGVSKAEREARKGLVGDLTISRFGQRAGYQRNELRSALARPSDIGGLVDTLNTWRRNIQKATHGGTERRLMRALDSAGKSLLRNAKAHDKVSAELDRAKGKLSDLRSSFSQLRDSVASGIRGSGNITQLASDNGRVTLGGIFSKLTGTRDQSKAFAGALDTLRKRGVSGSILADIGNAGLEGGGLDTATALLGASKSDIAAMNKLQGQIAASAKAAGTATATAMYGAGIKTAEGLVKGLEKQKKRLESVMDGVAKSFANSLKRALGIKGKAHGGVSGGGLTAVGERGWELLDLPAGSRVRPHGDSRRMAAGWGSGGGGPRPVYQVNLVVDGRTLGRVIVDPLRHEVRNLGGLQALGPYRGRDGSVL